MSAAYYVSEDREGRWWVETRDERGEAHVVDLTAYPSRDAALTASREIASQVDAEGRQGTVVES